MCAYSAQQLGVLSTASRRDSLVGFNAAALPELALSPIWHVAKCFSRLGDHGKALLLSSVSMGTPVDVMPSQVWIILSKPISTAKPILSNYKKIGRPRGFP